MGGLGKFDDETRARAVRMYQDRLRDHGEPKMAARRHVGELLGIILRRCGIGSRPPRGSLLGPAHLRAKTLWTWTK